MRLIIAEKDCGKWRTTVADVMVSAIHRMSPLGYKYFRFHASGDFYSRDYIRKVFEIARMCPRILFRTTTRRIDFRQELEDLNKLPNFIVRESLDPARFMPATDLPFAAISTLPIVQRVPSLFCIGDCDKCNHTCWRHDYNIHFEMH